MIFSTLRMAIIAALVLAVCTVTGAAQGNYKPGDRIEYKDGSNWYPGTIVKVMPEYNQVLVRWDPRDDYPSYTHNGVSSYQQGYSLSDVRPLGSQSAVQQTPARNGGNNGGSMGSIFGGGRTNKPQPPPTDQGTPGNGTGLMSKAEILGYMRSHGYKNGRPTKNVQVCKDLIEQIKRRGVQEAVTATTDDLSPIADNGCFGAENTDVAKASQMNLGAPIDENWLNGTWQMYVLGGTVDYAKGDGWIYRRNESLARIGWLKISADGSYTWKVNPSDPPARYIKGSWRAATPEEMDLQGGAGIMLENAADGREWLVTKYMDIFNKAERINAKEQGPAGARRIGWRN